jgi:cell division protein FtsW
MVLKRKINEARNLSEAMVGQVYRGQSREFYTLLFIVIFLAGFGTLMVVSSSAVDSAKNGNSVWAELFPQVGAIVVGALGLTVAAFMQPERIKKLLGLIFFVAMGLQVLVAFTGLGVTINGNRNWIRIAGMSFQPSEIIKIALIIFLAKYLTDANNYRPNQREYWYFPLTVFGVVGFFIVGLAQDVGSSLIIALTMFGMLFLGPISWTAVKRLVMLGLVGVIVVMLAGGSRRGRILAWAMPWMPDPADYNWQADHARWAFASGGIFGTGLGKSQMKWSWLPEAQNDFIFAIIGEEWGMLGALVTIICFVFLGITFMKIARKTDDPYRRFIVFGVMSWIMGQAFINIAVVLGLLPVLGVNLPLISSGGSSMLVTLTAIGMVLGVERQNGRGRPKLRVVKGGRSR